MIGRAKRTAKRWTRRLARQFDVARLEILTYHFVSARDNAFSRHGHRVDPATFRDQLRWLKQHYEVIALRDVPGLGARGPSPRPYAVITFDDGYRCTLDEAYPILEAERVVATLFVCPSVFDNRDLLWRDKVRYILDAKLEGELVAFLRTIPRRRYRFDLLGRRSFYRWSKDRDAVGDMSIQGDLDAFLARKGIAPASLAARDGLFMSADDLVVRPYLDLGNHSWSHPLMTALTAAEQREEIARTHGFLVARAIAPVAFALPFASYDDDTVAICGELAYPMMLSVLGRSNRLPAARREPPSRDPIVLHRRMAPTTLARLTEIV